MGGRLLLRLLADPTVTRVRSVARRPLPEHPKLRHTVADLRAPQARQALADVDVLWHLGFQLWRNRYRPAAAGEVNVGGTANVLAARPGRVVLASTAAVYGAWPDNPVPLPETARPRPNRECRYARDKLTVERMCADAVPTVTVRLPAVLGPHADPRVRRSVRGYRLAVPALRGAAQELQFLHEDEAAEALHILATTAPGVINAAPDDRLSAAQIAAVAGGRVCPLPRRAALPASEVLWRAGVLPFGADRAVLLGGPLALDVTRARELGWCARRGSAETLRAALA